MECICEGARTRVKSSVGLTEKIPVSVFINKKNIWAGESDCDGGAVERKERKTEAGGGLYSIRNDLLERQLSGEEAHDRVK